MEIAGKQKGANGIRGEGPLIPCLCLLSWMLLLSRGTSRQILSVSGHQFSGNSQATHDTARLSGSKFAGEGKVKVRVGVWPQGSGLPSLIGRFHFVYDQSARISNRVIEVGLR